MPLPQCNEPAGGGHTIPCGVEQANCGACRAGWPWRLPARAPSDPYVLTFEHTVPQPTGSPPPKGPRGEPSESRGQADRTSMGSACFPRPSRPADASLPSTGSSGASSPASTVLSRRYDSLPPVPPHFVAFAWWYLRVHSFFSLLGGRVRRRGPELFTRSPRPGSRRGGGRISQVPGGPQMSVRPVPSTPAGLRIPDRYGNAARPLGSQKQGLPRKVFRRSIAGFRTGGPRFAVRVTRAPRRTRFQLLVRLCWTGFPPAGSR